MKQVQQSASVLSEQRKLQIRMRWGYRVNFNLIEYYSRSLERRVQAYEYSLHKQIEAKHPWISFQIKKYNSLKKQQVIKFEVDNKNTPNTLRIVTDINPNRNLYQAITQHNIDKDIQTYMQSLAQEINTLHQADITHNLIRLQTAFEKDNALSLGIPYFRSVAQFVNQRGSYFVEQNLYCAPEVRLNEQFSKEGDIYALGVVFLQLCAQKIVTGQHQILQDLEAITNNKYKKMVKKMLDPQPQKRPTATQILDLITKKSESMDKILADADPFWKKQNIVVYRRNIFDMQTFNEPSITLKKYENYKDETYKIRIWMLNKEAVRIKISILSNKNTSLNLNFIETDSTIRQASQYITNVDALYCLFEQEHVETVNIDSSGFLEFSISNTQWFQLKIAYQKERFGKLGLTHQALLFSQKYRNFNRCTGKAKRQSLTEQEKKELNELEYFWPQVTEAFIDNKRFSQAITIAKFNIENYSHIEYNNYVGLGCEFETKGFTIKQIIDYYKQSASRKYKNPYDQLALCTLMSNSYQTNRYFLEEMNRKEPKNAAILFMLGNYEYNQSNFRLAEYQFDQFLDLQKDHPKATAFKYLCLFMQYGFLNKNQLSQVLKLFQDQKNNYGFGRILVELIMLAQDHRSISNQQMMEKVALIQSNTTKHLKKSVHLIMGTFLEKIGKIQFAQSYYRLYKNLNPGYPQIYRMLAQLIAAIDPDDLSQPLSLYIQWFEGLKKMNQNQVFPVTTAKPAKNISIIDVKSKQGTKEVGLAVDCIKKGNFSKAISFLQICVQKYERDVPIIYNLAKMYMRNKMYQQALVYLKKTIDLEPENAIFHYMSGLNYEYLYLEKESRQCYRRAFELSAHKNTFKKLYIYYDQNGHYGQLLKYVQKMIWLQPNKTEYYQIKANLLFALDFVGKSRLIRQFAQHLAEQTKQK